MFMKNKTLIKLLFFFLVTQVSIAQEIKNIYGKVTFEDQALSNVSVTIKNSPKGIQTDFNGNYKIDASVGDEILFSYVGLKTISILVEDVTSLLNIKMSAEINQLEDIVVKASKKKVKPSDIFLEGKEKLATAVGPLNLAATMGQVYYYGSKDISLGAPSLANSLAIRSGNLRADSEGNLYVRGVKAIWDIDSGIYENSSLVNTADVIDVYILSNAPARYSSKAVVIVKTNQSSQLIKIEKERATEEYKNQNYFDQNSVTTKLNFSQHDFSKENTEKKEIYGRVTFMESSIPDVVVSVVENKEFKFFTDAKGSYKINASIGDIIQFVHVSFETVSVIVEDVTKELNIELTQKINELDQVVIEASRKSGKVARQKKDADEAYTTSRGKKDPKKSGFSNTFVDGKSVSNVYANIQEALVGKISGYRYDRTTGASYLRGLGMSVTQDYPVAWEIDGTFTSNAPQIDLSDIKSIRALKSIGATNKYGTVAAGGLIIIETVYGGFDVKAKKDTFLEEYANSNFYNDDAMTMSLEKAEQNKYGLALEAYKNKYSAYEFYLEKLKDKLTNYADHLSIAMSFFEFHGDKDLAINVLNGLAMKHSENPEILKAIAYYFQFLEDKKSAIEVYQQIFRLRSKYSQSFRDLANAYVDYDLFEKAWKLYMGFMIKEYADSSEGIGELIYNDMEWLYFNRFNQTNIKQKFEPIHKNIDEFSNDVRLVFEWNTSEAEFELEFVNPDKRAYVFDHSLEANNDLIIEEKKLGYSSKLFFLEDIGDGEWLVNLTYKGNKKQVPTYLKLTSYYNWSKSNEKRRIEVYKLELQDQKIRLLTVNENLPVFEK
jgi:hypothetical protein